MTPVHMIWGGHRNHLPVVDTRDLPVFICPVTKMKPHWMSLPPQDAAENTFKELQADMQAAGHPFCFLHGFANEQGSGNDNVLSDSDITWWSKWAGAFTKLLTDLPDTETPSVIVFDHMRFGAGTFGDRRQPMSVKWADQVLMEPLRGLGIACGMYGTPSGWTHWTWPVAKPYDYTNQQYALDIPWFILPGQARGTAEPPSVEEYRANLLYANSIGYPSGLRAHWCEPETMGPKEWEMVMDEIEASLKFVPAEPEPVDPPKDPDPVAPFEISPAEENVIKALRALYDEYYNDWQE